ncbi:MAG: PASTA domain-containing protein, partial [Deltaproteobacteria bacterium]|nr:PASTA domain-containing protein [Deltaproteobacteria bacterium]
DILSAVATRYSLPSKETHTPVLVAKKVENSSEDNFSRVQLQEQDSSLEWVSTAENGNFIWRMPELEQMTLREVLHILNGHSFDLEVHGTGLVKSHLPKPGEQIAENGKIKLFLEVPL